MTEVINGSTTAHAPQYTITYRMPAQLFDDPIRTVDVYASRAEIQQLVEDGYLVRQRMIQGEQLQRLRTALDAIEAEERGDRAVASARFGGLFLRHLMDKRPAFLDLLKFPPTLSVARAVLGPLVQIRGLSARISYPTEEQQAVQWHVHQKTVPNPQPPFLSYPHGLDCLIYLDELNEANGPLVFLPGSHRRMDMDVPDQDFEDREGQVTVTAPAGSCVIIHSNVWHRAMPTTAAGTKRRLLILTYVPTWMRPAPYGVKPEHGLTDDLIENGDPETLELLGVRGYT